MSAAEWFSGMSGTTLFMTAQNRAALLVTRTSKRMRRRTLKFPDAHAALDYCLDHRACFVLMPANNHQSLN
jgi:hypothetical protein